ncbi:MAG: response regulator [Planctomycetes bacterium]|nr:response regulator [Planctomycetota bacterium]
MSEQAAPSAPFGAAGIDSAWVLEQAPDGLFVLDGDFRVVFHNPAFARILGRPGARLDGQTCSAAFGCAESGRPLCCGGCVLRLRLEPTSPAYDGEIPLPAPAGMRRRRAQLSLRRVAAADGRERLVGCLRDPACSDVAVRRQARFLDHMGHELRTPMVAIKGYVELVFSEKLGPIDRGQKRGLAIVARNVERLLGLIQNLLAHAKLALGALKFRPHAFPLERVLARATDVLAADFVARGLALEVVAPESALAVHGDEDLIALALRNLVLNAIKASPYGGRVGVRVEADPAAGRAYIDVIDAGCGMPDWALNFLAPAAGGEANPGAGTAGAPEAAAGAPVADLLDAPTPAPAGPSGGRTPEVAPNGAAADPVAATTPRPSAAPASGSLVGLSIVRGILELHRSEIQVTTRPGAGTRVRFSLPLTDEPVMAAPGERWKSAVPPPPAAHGRVILVVDDEEDAREAIGETLRRAGYAVLTAGDGEQALSVARHNALHLVLLDIHMRGLDGIETCRRLRAEPNLRGVPVYMMTAAAGRDVRLRSFAAGAEGFLEKPFEGSSLLDAVARALDRGAAERKVPAAST